MQTHQLAHLFIQVREPDPLEVKTDQLCTLILERLFHFNPQRSAELIWRIRTDTNKLLLARQELAAKDWLHG